MYNWLGPGPTVLKPDGSVVVKTASGSESPSASKLKDVSPDITSSKVKVTALACDAQARPKVRKIKNLKECLVAGEFLIRMRCGPAGWFVLIRASLHESGNKSMPHLNARIDSN